MEIKAIPYRTPACDDHLDENDSDECPWCQYDQLAKELAKVTQSSSGYARALGYLEGVIQRIISNPDFQKINGSEITDAIREAMTGVDKILQEK